MQDFRKLRVWQHAHRLRLSVYACARQFPLDERFGMTSQVRRSAASIATNIAESCGYSGRRDSARFVQMAVGSCCETLDHLITAAALGYITKAQLSEFESQLESIRRMLVALIDRMRNS
jgi:four helix bundle protein